MKRIRLPRLSGAGVLLLLFVAMPASAAQRLLPDFSHLVSAHAPTVVNISVTREPERAAFSSSTGEGESHPPAVAPRGQARGEDEPAPENTLGSGFIISSDGYILTCAHVTENASEILVRLNDRREFYARLVGSDRRSDIALLKIETRGLPTIVIGNPAKVKVGDWVLAIGSPFGFDSSATAGIVSAKGRTLPHEHYVSFLQTDVPINPGNSGGPLFNLRGEVIGVNSQIYSGTGGFMGVSFAIPIDAAMAIGAQLKSEGRVRRGWLGVSLQDVSRGLAGAYGLTRPRGALVADILPNSPAARSNLRPGDIVVEFEGKPVERSSDLPALVGLTMPGSPAKFHVFRRGQGMQTVIVTLGELREEATARPVAPRTRLDNSSRHGLSLRDLTGRQRKELDVDHGAGVIGVEEGRARIAGLRPGDVILEVDGKRVTDVTGLQRLLTHVPPGQTAVLRVRRGLATLFLALEAEDARSP